MKKTFIQSIGDLRTLGTRRELFWDFVSIVFGAALFLVAYILS